MARRAYGMRPLAGDSSQLPTREPNHRVTAVTFSPNGALLATAGTDGNAQVWDAANGQRLGSPMTFRPSARNGVVFSADGSYAATVSEGGADVWELNAQGGTSRKVFSTSVVDKALLTIQPEFRPSQPPPDQPTLEARMLRHRWATERLWEGIVGGSDDAYRAGLDVLAVTPLPFKQVSEQAGLARQLQRAAEQARKTMAKDDVDERARRYGEMLVTCAACHATQSH